MLCDRTRPRQNPCFFQLNTYIVMNFIFVIQSEGLRMCMPIAQITDYGCMMAISQVLHTQYHIWDILGLGLKFFWQERELMEINAKNGADSTAENTPNTPKFIWPICPIGPKVCDSVEYFIGCPQSVSSMDCNAL